MGMLSSIMRRNRAIFSICASLIIITPSFSAVGQDAGGETMHFRERTGDRVVYQESFERRLEDHLELRSESSAGEVHTVIVDAASLESISWHHVVAGSDTNYTARRTGRTINATGRNSGRTVNKTFRLDDGNPWIQSIERSLRDFVLSPRDRMEFWTIQPGDLELRKLQAVRRGHDLIQVDGEPVTAYEVRISLPGIGSMFWSATYWFRRSDGQFVRYEGVRGWPGTPKTVVEKIRHAPER